ncbi:MAG TPA: hypothetical protein IGS52_12050 [Oscillatoriaceae cyanobacterium M33_DOE_052]|uniref:DUF3718 domain-containing protein n=1 Tax=Planktothricoides sp. SpSt-374 TaxID=2282167 RepID=A0A7C3ZLC7_9CYAN|nr:hypothetical protein [Oscillatoriaceae cyanobacterium M33_DOE_052]
MKSAGIKLLGILGMGLLLGAGPVFAQDAPDLRVSMVEMGRMNVNDCLRKAEQAMRDMGMDDVEIKDRELAQGEEDETKAVVMCVRHEGETLATIAVSSNERNEAKDIRNELRERMKN